MYLTSFIQDGKMTVALSGEIDHHKAKAYIRELEGKIEAYLPERCILDFADVSFMDSSGIAVVINVLRAMKRLDGELFLSGVGNQPLKVFKAAGVDKLVKILEEVG